MPIILRLVGKLNKMTTYKISIITTSYKKIKKKTKKHCYIVEKYLQTVAKTYC